MHMSAAAMENTGAGEPTEDVEADREHQVEGSDELRDELRAEGVLRHGVIEVVRAHNAEETRCDACTDDLVDAVHRAPEEAKESARHVDSQRHCGVESAARDVPCTVTACDNDKADREAVELVPSAAAVLVGRSAI